jgi:hypothetical protein
MWLKSFERLIASILPRIWTHTEGIIHISWFQQTAND